MKTSCKRSFGTEALSRTVRVLFLFGLFCASALTFYLVLPEGVAGDEPAQNELARDIPKGIAEQPGEAKDLAGTYYRGDGKGFKLRLTLSADSTYTAQWHGCLGRYGQANGTWELKELQVLFTPITEEGSMEGYLRVLDVLKFKENWILLPLDQADRKFYEQWGVSTYSCFQNTNNLFRGP